jgi:hypothetical protein
MKKTGVLYTVTSENHLKCTCLKTSIVNANEKMVLRLVYNVLSTAVVM